jgi:hypothetical protein
MPVCAGEHFMTSCLLFAALAGFAPGPVPIEKLAPPFKSLNGMQRVSQAKIDPWVRGLYSVDRTYEARMSMEKAYIILYGESWPGRPAPTLGKQFESAGFRVERSGYTIEVGFRKGIAREQTTPNGGTRIDYLDRETAVTVDIRELPSMVGSLPRVWWKGAFSAEAPMKPVPLPFDAGVPAAAVAVTKWGSGGACHGGYVFSAVIERPYVEVLEQAKSKLIDAGYSWSDHNSVRPGYVNDSARVYWIQMEPGRDVEGKKMAGRTLVKWYWAPPGMR